MYGVVMENTIKTLLAQGKGQRAISRELGISRKVVKRFKDQLSNSLPSKGYKREKQLDSYNDIIKNYLEDGLTSILIHQKLAFKHGVDVSYSTVLRHVKEMQHSEVFVPLHSSPGEEAQVDFGYLGRFTLEADTPVKVWVFCMVLSHSRYAYYEAVTDQSVDTFIRCHIHAFEFFGGVPGTVLLDNLKAGVLQPDFYEPLLQEQYSEFLMYYGCAGRPCRVRKPEHKGKVESGVKYVKNNFLKGLEHRDFRRLILALKAWNVEVCNQRLHGTIRKIPLQVFQQIEKTALLSLPAQRYEIYHWEERKVNRLGHIVFQGSYYSVPHTLAGQTLRIKSNGSLLKIYHATAEVALHIPAQEPGQYITRTEHLPPYKQAKSPEYYREKLALIGPSAVEMMEAFRLQNHHWKDKVQGILQLRRHYSDTVIELACRRAIDHGCCSYQTVKNICEKGLVCEPLPDALPTNLGGFNHNLALYDQLSNPPAKSFLKQYFSSFKNY